VLRDVRLAGVITATGQSKQNPASSPNVTTPLVNKVDLTLWVYDSGTRKEEMKQPLKNVGHRGVIERCALAFGKGKRGSRSCVLAFVGPSFDAIEQSGEYSDLDDLLYGAEEEEEGIYVWEGYPVGIYCGGDGYPEFDGYTFGDGIWRKPTNEEGVALLAGDNPWVKECPDCELCSCMTRGGSIGSKNDCTLCSFGWKQAKHLPPPPLPPSGPTLVPLWTCPRCKGRRFVRKDLEDHA